MGVGINLTPAVNAVKELSSSINRLAKATEHSNQLLIEVEQSKKLADRRQFALNEIAYLREIYGNESEEVKKRLAEMKEEGL